MDDSINKNEAIAKLNAAVDKLKQGGKYWFDKKGLPALEFALDALKGREEKRNEKRDEDIMQINRNFKAISGFINQLDDRLKALEEKMGGTDEV